MKLPATLSSQGCFCYKQSLSIFPTVNTRGNCEIKGTGTHFSWKLRFSCHTKCQLSLERKCPLASAFLENQQDSLHLLVVRMERAWWPWICSLVRCWSNSGIAFYHHHHWGCNMEALSFDNSEQLWFRYAPSASILWTLKGTWNWHHPGYMPANNDNK